MIAKLNELLVKFDALRDRLGERDKLRVEVEALGKQVEAAKRGAASSKAASGQGEKHFELETAFQERREEYTAKHAALLRELQQYNENRLDILAAVLLDFFAAQKYFAYAYGRSLFRLHEQLREADEHSPVPLPNPTWQSLMTYVTQTDESRQLHSGEVRPSLIMKLASEEYGGAQHRSQGAFAAPLSPSSRSPPPPQTFTRPDSFASPDDVQFNPAVLHDPRNQPYLPLSVMKNLKQTRQAAQADPSSVHSTSTPAEPVIRKGQPPPPLQDPPHVTPAPSFSTLHSSLSRDTQPQQPPSLPPPIFDAFGDGGPPRPPPPNPRSPPSSAGFDILSMSFAAPPSQPAPPPPPPPAPGARAPGGPPPPPASRQPPPPASRAPVAAAGFAPPPPGGAPPPPRSAISPPPPASRQPAPPTPRTANPPSTAPWDAPVFPQPPPPSNRPPPSPSHAVSPRGSANGGFGFPAPPPPPPPPASRAQPPSGPPPPKPPKEWTPFDDDD